MDTKNSMVVGELINVTVKKPHLLEVPITQKVADNLKQKKGGLFQNEVDYQVLFPDFKPTQCEKGSEKRFRADLVGYSNAEFNIIEFKIYDELKYKTKNPWGVLYFFNQDRLKLEAAIKANSNNLTGKAIVVCAIRNTDFSDNDQQVSKMLANCNTPKKDRNPPIQNGRYFPILEAFSQHTLRESSFPWSFHRINKNNNIAFLVGSVAL